MKIKIYDYATKSICEVTQEQYDFINLLVKVKGRIDLARVRTETDLKVIDSWQSDENYWRIFNGYLGVLIRSQGLSPEFVKKYLLTILEGQEQPTKEQIQAVNSSLKILGISDLSRKTKIEFTPENTKIEFNDGLSETNGS